MSKLVTGPGKPDALREQLDELDQLMERMLALGVAPPREEIQNQSAVEVISSDSLESPPSLELSVSEGSASQDALPQADLPTESQVSETLKETASPENGLPALVDLAPPGPTFVALDTEPAIASTPFFADFQFAPPPGEIALNSLEAPASPPPATSTPLSSPTIAQEARPTVIVAWWLRPLALVNGIYDGSTGWLGPIGRGLQSRLVRNFLGLCGLAAMVGAAAWMIWEGVDWHT